MKKASFALLFFVVVQSHAQLLVHLNLSPQGVVEKSQLWPITLINTTNSALTLRVELTISDAKSGAPVLSASTKSFSINPGTTQINNAYLQPILYNVLGVGYNIDASSTGLLPLGDFAACYSFMAIQRENIVKLAEECTELVVEPLGPPQLVMPYDQSVLESKNPQLSWLPPMPANLFSNLKYDLELVEVLPNQSQEDAVQQNIPVFQQSSVSFTTIQYPLSAQALQLNKLYAWRVIAKSNETYIGKSETWVFKIKEFENADSLITNAVPYGELKTQDQPSYAIFSDELKFDYLNELEDSVWHISIYDLSSSERKIILLNMDSIPLKPGQNLVNYSVKNIPDFINRHLYLLEVINSRKESWRLRFEYRKPQD
jgi:hypothetical protein